MAATQYWGAGRWGTVSSAGFTSTAGSTAAIGSGVYKVRILATLAAYVTYGKAPVATSVNGTYVTAGIPEYVTVSPGEKFSAVGVDTLAATLFVTEIVS